MVRISVRGDLGARFLPQNLKNYLDNIVFVGAQNEAVNCIKNSGEIRSSLYTGSNQVQEGFIIIGPPGTGKTFVIAAGALLLLKEDDQRDRDSRSRLTQVAIATYTNSAADRVVEQFDEIFEQSHLPLPARQQLVKRIITSAQEVRDNVIPYTVSTFKPWGTSPEDWNEIRDDVDHSRIIVGTIYQINHALSNPKTNKIKQIQPKIIVFDEASQINISKLNLVIHRGNKKFETLGLVGDPYQLPPINHILELQNDVISTLMGISGLMPQRIQRIITLNNQRRMYSVIRELSETIGGYTVQIEDNPVTYQNDLGPTISSNVSLSQTLSELFGLEKRIIILDDSNHPETREIRIGTSRANPLEQNATELIASAFRIYYPNLNETDVMVIVPYSAQKKSLQNEEFRVGTVDAFQGQEARIVIGSTVISSNESPIDFVANRNRLNVLVSRAQCKLIILNHKTSFENDPIFRIIYQFIENHPDETTTINYDLNLEQEIRDFLKEANNNDNI